MQLTLRVPGTFRRPGDHDDLHCEFALDVSQITSLVRASVTDALGAQVLDLQRFQLARAAWDAMTPDQQRESAGEILRTVALGAVRGMTWERALMFFAQIFPNEEVRRQASPEACEKIVLAAADRIASEGTSWDGQRALRDALRVHVASIAAEQARREGLNALDDNTGKVSS